MRYFVAVFALIFVCFAFIFAHYKSDLREFSQFSNATKIYEIDGKNSYVYRFCDAK